MKRYVMLFAVVASGCGTFFNVGDNGSNEDDLIGLKPDGGQCGPVCAIYCPYGHVKDADGCDTCTCKPAPDAGQCGPVCAIYCEYGHVKDANGCDTCACNPPPPVKCGATECAAGEECCNSSCGICVQPGQGCTKQLCPPSRDAGACNPVVCTLACQYGFATGPDGCEICACAPPPSQPDAGACGPVCAIYCPYGHVKDGNGCDTCTCKPPPGGTQCGFNTCAAGLECCNASCGICVPPGGACTQQACACAPVVCTLACQYGFQRGADGCEICACAPPPKTCGNVTCGAGLECCNASCGICVPPGGACTQQACN